MDCNKKITAQLQHLLRLCGVEKELVIDWIMNEYEQLISDATHLVSSAAYKEAIKDGHNVEIKRSWSDFLADFKKGHDHSHPLIARFYYAVPSNIGKRVFDYLYSGIYDAKNPYSRSSVEAYTMNNPRGYGLIVYDIGNDGYLKNKCCITVGSKLLNNNPITEEQEHDLLRLLGLRVWNLKKKIAKLKGGEE